MWPVFWQTAGCLHARHSGTWSIFVLPWISVWWARPIRRFRLEPWTLNSGQNKHMFLTFYKHSDKLNKINSRVCKLYDIWNRKLASRLICSRNKIWLLNQLRGNRKWCKQPAVWTGSRSLQVSSFTGETNQTLQGIKQIKKTEKTDFPKQADSVKQGNKDVG